jgi:hypothetical protein
MDRIVTDGNTLSTRISTLHTELQTNHATVQARLSNLDGENNQILGTLANIEAKLNTLAPTPSTSFTPPATGSAHTAAQAPTLSGPTRVPDKEPKLKDPENYSGDRQESRPFLNQCRNIFRAQPARYDLEEKKVRKAVSHLTGAALKWVTPLLEKYDAGEDIPELRTFQDFADAIINNFGKTDNAQEAVRALENLRQKGACSTYATNFRRYAVESKYDDEALMRAFKKGLKSEIRKQLVSYYPTPDTLEELITACIKIDDELHQLAQDEKSFASPSSDKSPSKPKPTKTPRPAPTPPRPRPDPHGPTPMELDSIRASPAQIEDRKKKGLCLRCARKDHAFNDCPFDPKRLATKQAQLSTSPPASTSGTKYRSKKE